jgi:sec-independent protein translocase protein TatA
LIIAGVIILLFGARKLPEMARSLGKSAKAFKEETKGLKGDKGEDQDEPPAVPPAQTAQQLPQSQPQAQTQAQTNGAEPAAAEPPATESKPAESKPVEQAQQNNNAS